ncbi:MAG: carbohydrate ABC transporter permease [Chloroflexi bacterium]|nr:carbohydrate ABC transporter permease [Chloroflexota bacterium]
MTKPTRGAGAKLLKRLVDAVSWLLLALGALAMAFPLLWMLTGSLKTVEEIFTVPIVWLPADPNFGSYSKVIAEAHISRAFLNSLIVTIPTVITTVFFSSLAGYAFAKFRSLGLDILFTMVLAIMMIPLTVILIPMYITAWELKLLDTHVGLMLPRLMSAFGIFLFRQMMANIPDELIDAARIDGAGEFRIYWQIAMPLSKPAITSLAILSFQWTWNDFLWPVMISTSEKTRTIVLAVSVIQGSQEYGQSPFNELMAAATIALMPLILVFVLGQRYFVSGIASSGIKG